ncbi:chondroitin sulfate synthase 2 [Biomphalaria glabrata]
MKFWRCRRLLLRCSFDFKCISRAFLPALVGLCLGMTVSMMYAPFSEDSCETFIAKQDPQKMIKLRDTKSFDAQNDESYEPRVLEPPMDESKYKVDTKAGAKFFRPKFAATELGIREKLFVAVLSSKDTLNTLAVAVNRTVSQYVTKTVYFIDKKAAVVPGGMVIVNFDDGYNHLMPTNVFKFVIKKYGQDYDYFMFLSDKGYVRAEKVFDLVSHISVSKHVHLGTPKGVEGGKTYCSLEGGVIISQLSPISFLAVPLLDCYQQSQDCPSTGLLSTKSRLTLYWTAINKVKTVPLLDCYQQSQDCPSTGLLSTKSRLSLYWTAINKVKTVPLLDCYQQSQDCPSTGLLSTKSRLSLYWTAINKVKTVPLLDCYQQSQDCPSTGLLSTKSRLSLYWTAINKVKTVPLLDCYQQSQDCPSTGLLSTKSRLSLYWTAINKVKTVPLLDCYQQSQDCPSTGLLSTKSRLSLYWTAINKVKTVPLLDCYQQSQDCPSTGLLSTKSRLSLYWTAINKVKTVPLLDCYQQSQDCPSTGLLSTKSRLSLYWTVINKVKTVPLLDCYQQSQDCPSTGLLSTKSRLSLYWTAINKVKTVPLLDCYQQSQDCPSTGLLSTKSRLSLYWTAINKVKTVPLLDCYQQSQDCPSTGLLSTKSRLSLYWTAINKVKTVPLLDCYQQSQDCPSTGLLSTKSRLSLYWTAINKVKTSLLSLVNSSLKWCSENCHSLDSSVNFGKCLLHATDLECHSTVANKVYTAYPVKNLNFNKDIEALREQANFNKSLSVFPMPDEITHYKMHRYFCEVELNSTRHQIQEMKDNILYMSQFAPGGRDSISWPIGVPEPYKPKNRFDVIRWDYFTETHIFFQDDFTNVKELIGIDKLDIQDIIKISMEKLNEQHNNKYLYSYLINGYRRFDPQRGMEYLLDLALEDTSIPPEENNKNNYNKRIIEKRVFLVRPLGEVEVVPMPYVTESTRLNIILSITPNEMDGWGVFLETYARLQAESADSLALIIVFVYPQVPKTGEEDVFSVLKSMVTYYDDKSEDGVKTRMINFANNGTYVPEFKIIDTVSDLLDPDALILTCTVGMLLNAEMLNRVRINTIPGWQVFFPIGFWQYKPNIIYDKKPYPTDIEFSSRTGHYDVLSYEHGSFYNSDYKDSRKSFSIEELMKYDLYEMFVRYGKVHVFRAVEPEFKHYYMQLDCPVNIPSKLYERCLERKSMNLATRAQLAKRIFQYQAKREMQHSTQNGNKE